MGSLARYEAVWGYRCCLVIAPLLNGSLRSLLLWQWMRRMHGAHEPRKCYAHIFAEQSNLTHTQQYVQLQQAALFLQFCRALLHIGQVSFFFWFLGWNFLSKYITRPAFLRAVALQAMPTKVANKFYLSCVHLCLTMYTLSREGMGMKSVGPSEELEEVEAELGMIKKGDADDQGRLHYTHTCMIFQHAHTHTRCANRMHSLHSPQRSARAGYDLFRNKRLFAFMHASKNISVLGTSRSCDFLPRIRHIRPHIHVHITQGYKHAFYIHISCNQTGKHAYVHAYRGRWACHLPTSSMRSRIYFHNHSLHAWASNPCNLDTAPHWVWRSLPTAFCRRCRERRDQRRVRRPRRPFQAARLGARRHVASIHADGEYDACIAERSHWCLILCFACHRKTLELALELSVRVVESDWISCHPILVCIMYVRAFRMPSNSHLTSASSARRQGSSLGDNAMTLILYGSSSQSGETAHR